MRAGRLGRAELVGLAGLLALAAVLRFVDLPTRGAWDADQGNDMLTLWSIVHEGTWPLLGPPTSIGDFHHGVLYYYLLAPAAFVSAADPLAVVAFIAACGVAAVAVVWWLGRSIGGPVAGFVAALLMAVSASAIEESTFIWNPNLIALSSAVALAAAWRAWTMRRAGWWVVAAIAQAVTMHCHVLGSVMVVPLAALLIADLRRRGATGERRPVASAAVVGLTLIAVSYVPLLVSDLQTGFAEARAAADFLTGGSEGAGVPLAQRLAIVPLRVLSWPLTGLITAQPIAGILAAAAVVAILAWRARGTDTDEGTAVRWFAATLGWCALALAVGASSLASVVPGLPNDHYHAFLDPVVFVVVGLGASALWRLRPVGRLAAAASATALIGLNATIWPPATAPDGGYPLARHAAEQVAGTVDGELVRLSGLPALKNTAAYGFPLRQLGVDPVEDGTATRLVVACDRLLEPIIGTACGGPAEAALTGGSDWVLVERFDASDRTVISIYR